jgi:hypothetical protein
MTTMSETTKDTGYVHLSDCIRQETAISQYLTCACTSLRHSLGLMDIKILTSLRL